MPPSFRKKRTKAQHSERRTVTLLFCDVANSTKMASQLDAEEWLDIMDAAFDHLIPPVERYGGTVAHLMGDAILALFGAPTAHEDDPQRAILASLAMLAELAPLQAEIKQTYGLDFNVRIGLNTGPVVVGEIGSGDTIEYTAMGDAVNVAARMEQSATAGAIHISHDTYQLIAPLFDVTPLGPLQLKGKDEPMLTYRVEAPKAQPGRLRGLPELHAPLVGRDPERQRLVHALTATAAGHGQLIFLIGEAGLGKSRLLRELHTAWQTYQLPANYWLIGRALSYDTTRPYGLLQQLIRQLLTIPENATAATMTAIITETTPFFPATSAATWREALLTMLTIATETTPMHLEGQALQRELLTAITALCHHATQKHPLVLICDDLHWADASSLDLLEQIMPLITQLPLLIIASSRPETDTPAWQLQERATTLFPQQRQTIRLHPLKETESDALVNHLLTIANLPDQLRHQLRQKTEGNPFFVEEVVRTLIAEGIIIRTTDGLHWQATTNDHTIQIPDNIESLLIARIDKLEKETRRTLQIAAIIGRYFTRPLLATIRPNTAQLDQQLATLQQADLISRQSTTAVETYRFRHMLTRDAAYHTLLRRERRTYHHQVAQALATLFAAQPDEEAHRIAYHFAQGGQIQEALHYYRLAGTTATRLHAHKEASDHYQQALTLAQQPDTLSDLIAHGRQHPQEDIILTLYKELGRVWEVSGQQPQALTLYQTFAQLATTHQQDRWRLAALLAQATLHATPNTLYAPDKVTLFLDEAQQLAHQLDDYEAQAQVYWIRLLLGLVADTTPDDAIAHGEKGLAIARAHGLIERQAYLLNDIARAYLPAGRLEDTTQALSQAQTLWRQLENWSMLADNLATSASNQIVHSNWQASIDASNQGLDISRRTGNLWGQAYNMLMKGQAFIQQGELGQALDTFEQALPLAQAANFMAPASFVPAIIARINLSYGDLATAQTNINTAIANGQQNQQGLFISLISAIRVMTYSQQLHQAQIYLDQLLSRMETTPLGHTNMSLIMAQAELALAHNDYDHAQTLINKLEPTQDTPALDVLRPDIYLIQGQLFQTQQNLPAAQTAFTQAENHASELNLKRFLWLIYIHQADTYHQQGLTTQAQHYCHLAHQETAWFASRLGNENRQQLFATTPLMQTLNALPYLK